LLIAAHCIEVADPGVNPSMVIGPHSACQWDLALLPAENFAWAAGHWATYSIHIRLI